MRGESKFILAIISLIFSLTSIILMGSLGKGLAIIAIVLALTSIFTPIKN